VGENKFLYWLVVWIRIKPVLKIPVSLLP
jgi:hypothetical protein